jgi:GNAT superfamily N-acetyltransferase
VIRTVDPRLQRDVAALIDLRARWAEERTGIAVDPGYRADFTDWLRREQDQRTFWVAEVDGAAVGMTNLLTFERMPVPGRAAGRWGYLGNMFVLGEHRDVGVGRLLLDAVLAHADRHGLVRVVLSPSDRSVPFYRRAGFGDAVELLLRRRPPVAASDDAPS